MKYRKIINIFLLMFVMFVTAYSKKTEFKPSTLKINLNKVVALANGEDQIKITYEIKDNNGIPLRKVDKTKLKLTIDGVETDNFILTSKTEKIVEITLSYDKLMVKEKIKFIKDRRSLRLHLSKNRLLANGRDKIIITALNENGESWKDDVSIYVNNKKIEGNIFKTKNVGTYKIEAKSGKFKSNTEKVVAYEKIEKLTLKGNKEKVLVNGVDKIIFTLEGKDQNNKTKKIEKFILVDSKGRKISNSNEIIPKKTGVFKVRALYKGEYSNYITYKAIVPENLQVISTYPVESTINVDDKIEITLNMDIKNYEDGVEVTVDNEPVLGTTYYNKNTKTIMFTPNDKLILGKTYNVKVKKEILGINENKLSKEITFKFKVIERKKTDLVKVERGEFILGDKTGQLWEFSSPTQEAYITYDYLIGKTEVTFEEYDQYSRDMRIPLVEDNGWGRKTRPVINISWNDAIKYLNWLSQQEGLPVAYDSEGNLIDSEGNRTRDITKVLGYRLPTEIEWEYAGRGGKNGKDTLFSGSNKVGEVAWYSENSQGKTHEVGTKLKNELGIYDMSGNVWEWVNDNSGVYSGIERINSVGPKKKGLKILRGGSFNSIESDTRISFRDELSPNTKDIYYGFRIARTIKEKK